MILAHVTLPTGEVEKTARFIERTLGYARKETPADSPVDVVWFDLGHGQDMHLLHVDRYEVGAFEGEFGRHVALRHPAGDFAALKARLVEAGGTLIDPLRPTPFARFFVREPVNGYVFEIIES